MHFQDTPPLVSVRILTYNASKSIIETLNSVFNQTYNNIELIVSDDCSKDDTVSIVEEWIKKHKDRFTKVTFLTSTINTGVCANSKRSLEATSGDWIKGLGGDDLLTPDAIEKYISFVLANNCNICAARMSYIDVNSNVIDIKHGVTHVKYMDYLRLPYKKQFRLCKQKIIVPGPVLFYSRKVYQSTGGPDGNYGAADEWSFLYKVMKCGFRIFGIDEVLVKYRVHEGSLTHLGQQSKSPYYRECNLRFLKEEIMPELRRNNDFVLLWHSYIQCWVWKNGEKKLLNLIDPMWYINDAWYSIKARIGIL